MLLGSRIASALKWLLISTFAQRLITWSISIIVIRILRPEDYGLYALAMVLIEFFVTFNDLGLNAALIQKRTSDESARRVYGAIIVANVGMFGLIQLVATPFAVLVNQPEIGPITRFMALQLLIMSLTSVPQALLIRSISFRTLSILEVVRTATNSLVALTLAISGFGVWALAISSVVAASVYSVALLAVSKIRVRPDFRIQGIRDELRFGSYMVGKSAFRAVNQHLPTLLIGRLLGTMPLGIFSVGADIARIPNRFLLRPIARVSFPAISILQDDALQAKRAFLRIVSSTLIVTLPICWGLGVVSDELVEIVLGRKWLGAASIILLFSFVMPIRTIFRLLQTTLDGIGRPDVGIRNLATFSVCLLPALSVGILAGIEGVAAGWCCAQVVAFIVNLRRSLPVLGVQTSELIEVIQGTLISGALMLASILLLKTQMPTHLVSFSGLAALIGMGAVVYGTATWMLNRALALETFKFIRS